MDYDLQVATLPVSDLDKAKAFCTEKDGFTLDVDYGPADFRVVQLTPPGPAYSGIGLTDAVPGLNACGHNATVGEPAGWRPIYADAEIASVGLTEAEAREQYGEDVATGTFPWIANARAVMQNETAGWVKSIHTTRDGGALLGLVMIGPHVTDMVEAGVVAIDSGAPVETVADGLAPHPTLSEAIKDAALVALGRAIDPGNGNLEK